MNGTNCWGLRTGSLLVVAVLIAASLLARSDRAAAESAPCVVPAALPADVASRWCSWVTRNGAAETFAIFALELRVAGRHCEALRLAERGAELGSHGAYVQIAYIKKDGDCGKRDLPGAISAFESALKLRSPLAGGNLSMVYEGRGVWREYRDPAKAMMWAWANYLLNAYPHDDDERGFGRRLGLGETEIDHARERMRRWLAEHKVHMKPRPWLCTPYHGKVPAECIR